MWNGSGGAVSDDDDDEAAIDDFVLEVEAAETADPSATRTFFFLPQGSEEAERQRRRHGTRGRTVPSTTAVPLWRRCVWYVQDRRRCVLGVLLAMALVLALLYGLSVLAPGLLRHTGGDDDDDTGGVVGSAFAAEPRWRRRARRDPHPADMDAVLRTLTRHSHMSGTEEVKRVAEYIRDQWRSFGIPAELETYRVLLGGEPQHLRLQWSDRAGSVSAADSLVQATEPPIARDPDTAVVRNGTAFHGYAASGRVHGAPVVYANYGRPEDFAVLEARNVTVTGRIVLVRYGLLFRGLKVRLAQQRGAAGVLIYSDPADDGERRGATYPQGPWRPPHSVQRGSVQFNSMCVGDPSTPGYGSVADVPRRTYAEAVAAGCLPSIPSLPLSAADADRILQRMQASLADAAAVERQRATPPDPFVGGLERSRYVLFGGDAARLDFELEHAYRLRPVYNVLGMVGGVGETDPREVVFGNHHDAWVYGAVDPHTGTVVQMEVARTLGAMLQQGWRPRRTVVLASWDAEEWGTIGSVEHVEAQLHTRIRPRTIAYINADVIVSGPTARVGVDGSPLLTQAVVQAMQALPEPVTGDEMLAEWRARRRDAMQAEMGSSSSGNASSTAHDWLPLLGLLGGGSDHTAFLHHAGVSAVDFGFDELDHPSYPVYHSIYDDYAYARRFNDDRFRLHRVATQLVATLMVDLADAVLLPMNVSDYSEWMRYQMQLWQRQAPGELVEVQQTVRPALEELHAAVAAFQQRVRTLAQAYASQPRSRPAAAAAGADRELQRLAVNQALLDFERALLHADGGLPERPWYRHTMMAPHRDKGYAAMALPFLEHPGYNHTSIPHQQVHSGLKVTADAIRRATQVLQRALQPSPPSTEPGAARRALDTSQ
ncbi:hypothetical protein CDCA_CDCA12G3491 [Cyanidium caldarium]|uniref:Glutamate carboxypeptidase II n=1 Tax=Cyanidium caldarium TaxID=2771 RepID=A0AAV9IZB5_CYACA|nr:hypothetical protein CDCA_CDCA12G3491 [Cyanidium caldarium]